MLWRREKTYLHVGLTDWDTICKISSNQLHLNFLSDQHKTQCSRAEVTNKHRLVFESICIEKFMFCKIPVTAVPYIR